MENVYKSENNIISNFSQNRFSNTMIYHYIKILNNTTRSTLHCQRSKRTMDHQLPPPLISFKLNIINIYILSEVFM